MKKQLTLSEKILRITKAASVVERKGVNAEEGYKYAKTEDILDAVRNLMDRNRLILTGDYWHGSLAHHATAKGCVRDVVVRWRLKDADTGEETTYDIPGSGWDYTDKGTAKALTMSRKYALIFIFNLRIADEPEEFVYIDKEEATARAQAVGEKKVKELQEKMKGAKHAEGTEARPATNADASVS